MGRAIKHPVPDRVKPFVISNIWHPGILTLSPERQSARMSNITNDERLNPVWHMMLYQYGNSWRQRVNSMPSSWMEIAVVFVEICSVFTAVLFTRCVLLCAYLKHYDNSYYDYYDGRCCYYFTHYNWTRLSCGCEHCGDIVLRHFVWVTHITPRSCLTVTYCGVSELHDKASSKVWI